MAEKKELNPSPKFPDGKSPELSPNPKLEDGLINRTNEKPNTEGSGEPKQQAKPDYVTREEAIQIAREYGGVEDFDGEIEQSLLDGELKRVLQTKTFGVSDYPLTSDIDNQHSSVNEGLLPNGDMEDLTESQINKIVVTLNRIINKGWLKVSTLRALKLTSVMYDSTVISIAASSTVYNASGIVSGVSYLITLDIANSSYSYAYGSYTAG